MSSNNHITKWIFFGHKTLQSLIMYRLETSSFFRFCCKWQGCDHVIQFYHTSWVAVVTPTDRPKSVRNRCVIEAFSGLYVLSLCLLEIFVGVGVFDIGLSQISFFFSLFI